MMKKIISCLILCAMLLSLIPLSVSAAGTTEEVVVTMTDYYNYKKNSGTITSGYNVITISSVEELNMLPDFTNNSDFEDKTIRLIADIDYSKSASEWKSLIFEGTFDGNGHTISNLKCASTTNGAGLFRVASGTFKDLTLVNIDVTTSTGITGAGALIGTRNNINVNSTDLFISNVHVINGKISATDQVGGIIGNTVVNGNTKRATTIENCSFNGTISASATSAAYTGGIVGYVSGNTTVVISDCVVKGTTITTVSDVSYVGYLIGRVNSVTSAQVSGCTVACTTATPSATENTFVGDGYSKLTNGENWGAFVNSYVVGYQEKADGNNTDYRFVAAVALPEGKTISDYTDVGFYVTLTKNGEESNYNNTKVPCHNVYKSVSGTKAGDTEPTVYQASDYGADYLFVVVFEDVPAGSSFEVTLTPYLTPAEGTELVGAADTLKKN